MSLTAKDFLSRVLPWPPLGDPNAFFNVHYTFEPKDHPSGTRLPLAGEAFNTVDEMAGFIAGKVKQYGTRDVYVCMSSQRMAEAKQRANGTSYNKAIRSQQGAAQLKSLFIDVDVKDGAYPTTEEAVQALGAFCSQSGMPLPTLVVLTGSGGFHAHWVLEQPLTLPEWTPYAEALRRCTDHYGLLTDGGVTIDAARILRVPGSSNWKTGVARPATGRILNDVNYPLAQLDAALEPFKQPTLGAPAVTLGVNDELGAGIESRQARPVLLDTILPSCGFLRDAVATGGADLPNPLWNLTTLIATFTEGGREDAHRMAMGHEAYTAETTDELFDRKVNERETKNMGWPRCQTIAANGCTSCATCPAFQFDKSPLNMGRPTPNAQPLATAGDMPDGYQRMPDGTVWMLKKDENGVTTAHQICPYPLENGWLQENPWTLHFTTKIAGRASLVHITSEKLSSKQEALKTLGAQGLSFGDKQTNVVKEFLVAWLQRLQTQRSAIVTATPFGWSLDNGDVEGFSFGGRVWMPKSDKPASAGLLTQQYKPMGALSTWKQAARMVTDQRRPELDAILASAFAAPLVRFTGQSGLLVSAFSTESGIGKSTALKIAQAVWGHPIQGVQSLSDTSNSVIKKIGELKALPVYWDELKSEEQTAKFVALAFQLSGGKEKSRLNSDTSFRESGTWETILLAASNDSLMDTICRGTKTTTAGLYRVFEFAVPPGSSRGKISPGDAQQMLAKLNAHHGTAGLEYGKWLGANHVVVEKAVSTLYSKLFEPGQLDAKQDERFWIATVAVTLLGAKFANGLGLTDIDIPALQKFLFNHVRTLRSTRDATSVDLNNGANVINILAQFLSATAARRTLKTNIIHQGRGKPANGAVTVVRAPLANFDRLSVQIGVDDQRMRIVKADLLDWLEDRGIGQSVMLQALFKTYGAKTIHGRVGSGTDMASATQYLLELDLTNAALAGQIEI